MPVRTTRLDSGTLAASQVSQLFVVPTGYSVIVKSVYGYTYASAQGQVLMQGHRPPAANQVVSTVVCDPQRPYRWDGWLVLDGGCIFALQNALDNVTTFWVSGTLLPGDVPDTAVSKPA